MPLDDITHPFLQSCANLPPGKLVKAPNLHMLDAMNALTILDPRMDTGIRTGVGAASPLSSCASADEVLAVIDRLVQNETAWHAGWPVVPTLFTSRHLLSNSSHPTNPPPARAGAGPLDEILMAYVRTYESCLAYTWHELARGALFEGEDWQGDLAGREEWEVPELREGEGEGEGLRDALHVLDGLAVDPELKHQLQLRLAIRQSFLFLLATTISGGTPSPGIPPPPPPPLPHPLSFPTDGPGPGLAERFFDRAIPRRFRQSMPVPEVVPLPTPAEAYAELGRTFRGLCWACEVRDWTQRPALEARERQASVFSLGPEAREEAAATAAWSPIVRSCMTWSIVDGFVYPLQQADLIRQWMTEYASAPGTEFELDRALYRASGESIERLGQVRRFFDVLCENIRMDMHDRCQNRARQHRLHTLSARRWETLGSLLPPRGILEPEEHAQIARGVSARRGDALLDAALASLDLGLVDSAEWGPVYWVLWRVAEDRGAREGRRRTSWRGAWARAWAHAGRGLHHAFAMSPKAKTSLHSRAVFDHRFGPFQPKSAPDEDTLHFRPYTYDDYARSCRDARQLSAEALGEQVKSSFRSAAKAFDDAHAQLESHDTGPGEQQRAANETHKAICKYLQGQVQAYVAIDADKDPAGCGSRWAKWLPPVQDVHKALCGLG
ncbi:N-alpha-acetyltransferase, non-catalitic subunit [Naganishia albida]|nr:N-alpha-acetyltransferase, non-catalitic subunit [Naganishia albida]